VSTTESSLRRSQIRTAARTRRLPLAAALALLLAAPAFAQETPKAEAAPDAGGSWIKPKPAKKKKAAPAEVKPDAAPAPAAAAAPNAVPAAGAPAAVAPAAAATAKRPAVAPPGATAAPAALAPAAAAPAKPPAIAPPGAAAAPAGPPPALAPATAAPNAAPAPAPVIVKVQEKPAPPAAADDFDLLAPAPVLDAAQLAQAKALEEKLLLRRKLLGLHQVAGFVNLAGVTAAVVLGQLNYNDKYGGGGDTEKWIKPHAIAAYSSAAIFAATGLLALFAPSPIDQPTRLSTATVHKACMAVATAGMVAQVVLGIVAASKQGQISQRDYALAHQVIGYTTAVATAGGFVAITW
jgi:hypothetical protein